MRLTLFFSIIFISVFTFAQDAADENLNFNMDPPSIAKQKQQQVGRMRAVKLYKAKGHIGESDNGMLAIREPKMINKEELAVIQKLVDEENRDRAVIIDEISKVNKFDEKKKQQFVNVYYSTWKNVDPKGTYYFEKSTWQKKY